jgi:predicted  nucleic acid-binding Zn-ribbon protein
MIMSVRITKLCSILGFKKLKMATAGMYSYEHPRRIRPLLLSSENRKPRAHDENGALESKALMYDDAIARLEENLSEKINTLFNRVEKCSDLAVASSRAVSALSTQFEDFKADSEQRMQAVTVSVAELRESMNRVCSESQNLTMTALEECCNELVKQIKSNSENINRMGETISKVENDTRSRVGKFEKEFEDLKSDFATVSKRVDENRSWTAGLGEEMRLLAEEAVNSGLEDLTHKFTKDLETFDLDWKDYRENLDQRLVTFDHKINHTERAWSSRYDELKALFEERMKSEIDVRVKDTLIPSAVNKVRREMESELEDIRRVVHAIPRASEFPEQAIRNISNEITQVQAAMASFTSATVPSLYKEIDIKIASSEHEAQQRFLHLLKEFAIELEFDIDRMIELIHSVFVQARIPLPPGTSSSWERFRDVVFEREQISGIRVRRPILGEPANQRTPRLGSRSTRSGRF